MVRHRAEREMIVNLARVHRTTNADELQQALDVPAARDAPRRLTTAWYVRSTREAQEIVSELVH